MRACSRAVHLARVQRARKASAASDKAGNARRAQEEEVEEKRERVGRGKRCAAGVIHLLEKHGKRQITRRGFERRSAP